MPHCDHTSNLASKLEEIGRQLASLEQRLCAVETPVLERILTPADLAVRLGVTERALAEWRVGPPATGPAYVRIGRGIRYVSTSVDAWLLAQEFSSTREESGR